MNWLFPKFLAGVLAAGLPIALHFYRRWRRRSIVFPSLHFFREGVRPSDSFWYRLRRWIVLILRCVLLALLAATFARPFWGTDSAKGNKTVIVVVDNSYSLQAAGRWSRLHQWAKQAAGDFEPGDRLGVLLAGPIPTWLVSPTTDTAAAQHAFEELSPGWLSCRLEPALRLAGAALEASKSARQQVIVVTDHQRLSWSGTDFSHALPRSVTAVFPPVAPEVERQAALLPPEIGSVRGKIQISLPIRNFTARQTRVLRVHLNGATTPIHEETIELPAHETRVVQIALALPLDRAAYFQLDLDPDDLAADDTAYGVWQPIPAGRVLLDPPAAGASTDYLAAAFDQMADLDPAISAAALPPAEWAVGSVAVLRDDRSFSGSNLAHLETFIEHGGTALVFCGDNPDQRIWLARHGIQVAALSEQPEGWRIYDWALEHPLLASLTQSRLKPIVGWVFTRGWGIPPNTVTPLAYWSKDAVAIGEAQIGAGRIVLCGFAPDRADSDWPVTGSFLPFIHQAVAYLLRTERVSATSGQVGQSLDLAGGVDPWRLLVGPKAAPPPIQSGRIFLPLSPGIYERAGRSSPSTVAVNLVPEESDLAPWTGGRPWTAWAGAPVLPRAAGPRDRAADETAEDDSRLWEWTLGMAAALLLVELVLANRTPR